MKKNEKSILIIIGMFLIASLGFSKDKGKPETSLPEFQSILSDKIVDQISGEELVGVAVKIERTDKTGYTDFDSNFEFGNIQFGDYKLNFELISYKEIKIQKIHIGQNEVHELNINLLQKQ